MAGTIESTSTKSSQLRRLGAAAIAAWSFAAVVLAYAIHPSLPFNTIRLPFERRVQAYAVAPEGWKFFTRDPQERRIFRYWRGDDGQWRELPGVRNATAANAFGLNRSGLAQGHEMAAMLAKVPASSWQPCKSEPLACLDAAPRTAIANEAARPSLCREIGFVAQAPVPWAWARSGETIVMTSKVVRLEVSCSAQ